MRCSDASHLACLVLALCLVPGLVGAGPPDARSTAAEREALALTVYNQDFALVREVRSVALGRGTRALEFRDVAAAIEPETVHIRALDAADSLHVLEQNYRYALLNPRKLLEKYVGRKVRVYRWNEKLGRDEALDAEVLAVEEGTVLRIGEEITFDFPGRLAFPEIPENLIARPTLVWLLERDRPRQRIETSYLTGRLGWKADYVLVLGAEAKRASLTGWVTLHNRSGAAYENARLKLVAGDVRRVKADRARPYAAQEMAIAGARAPQFREEGFFEYHLYTLSRPATLLDNEQKQITLLEASGIEVVKRLILRGAAVHFRGRHGERPPDKVGVYLDVENREDKGLGLPLPAGIVRVYQADTAGAQQFVGEDRIDHTPRDERLRIQVGEAFDVVGERRQTDYRALGSCASESGWRIEVRNHKDEAVEVEVVEPASGDWRIVRSSQAAEKIDAHTFRFVVQVPARGAETIEYLVHVRWC
jgi:hypothetical protein